MGGRGMELRACLCLTAPTSSTVGDATLWTVLGIGSKYTKAQYRQYTDATFSVRVASVHRQPRIDAWGAKRCACGTSGARAAHASLPPHLQLRHSMPAASFRSLATSWLQSLTPSTPPRRPQCIDQ